MNRLSALINLGSEPSPERRCALLRGVTDLFFESEAHAPAQLAMFDQLMFQLAGEMEAAVREELAWRLSESAAPPPSIARRLAADEDVHVAAPMLTSSTALNDADLLSIARARGQEHMQAISQRSELSTTVTDALMVLGDDQTLGVLLRNDGADLSREAHEAAVHRAFKNPKLHADLVRRNALPIDLLNDMYFAVETRLRTEIIKRNTAVDHDALEDALRAGREEIARRDGALPDDHADAEKAIRNLKKTGGLTPGVLAGLLRGHKTTQFLIALAEMADIDFHTARRIFERRELDMLAIVCKAAGFDRALFLTLAMLILDRAANAMGRAKEYGELYMALPTETARRTIRFWKTRREIGDVAAA